MGVCCHHYVITFAIKMAAGNCWCTCRDSGRCDWVPHIQCFLVRSDRPRELYPSFITERLPTTVIKQPTNMTKRSLPESTEQVEKHLRPTLISQPSASSEFEPTVPPKPRTLRLSGIPLSLGEGQLRTSLNALIDKTQPNGENILALSLALYHGRLVATVTFLHEPSIFKECRPLHSIELPIPTNLAGSSEDDMIIDIIADCDFYGITPLYHPPHPEEPSFE